MQSCSSDQIEEKTIYVSTIIDAYNYGTVVQALATQEILRGFGKVRFFDYLRKQWTWRGWFAGALHASELGRFGFAKRIVGGFPNRLRGWWVFRRFAKRNLSLCRRDPWNDKRFDAAGALFCTGSDQTWNYECNRGVDEVYFLANAPRGVKKFSFCASFGRGRIDEGETKKTRDLLSTYSALSVRESSAAVILEGLGFSQSVVLLDPTLLAGVDVLEKHSSSKRVIEGDYVLAYQLNNNEELIAAAEEVAAKLGMKIVQVGFSWHKAAPEGWERVFLPSVPDWLALFRDASYVVTDSFHGVCLSVLNRKRFNVVLPDLYSVRLVDVLNEFGLSGRIVGESGVLDMSMIDWHFVDSRLQDRRDAMRLFLNGVVGERKAVGGNV